MVFLNKVESILVAITGSHPGCGCVFWTAAAVGRARCRARYCSLIPSAAARCSGPRTRGGNLTRHAVACDLPRRKDLENCGPLPRPPPPKAHFRGLAIVSIQKKKTTEPLM